MKLLSVIVPIYNTQKYLEQCLLSIQKQTYKELQVICIDDGSTDQSGKIADKFASEDKRFQVIHQENKGESVARNRGLEMAKGEYITFVDCDDWIEKEMYKKLIDAIEKENADMSIGSWFLDKEEISTPIKNEERVDIILDNKKLLRCIYERDRYRAFAYIWDKIYRRELFDETNGQLRFDENLSMGADVLILGQLALKAQKSVYTDIPFYHYRQRQQSTCHSVDLTKRYDWITAYEKLIFHMEKSYNTDKIIVDYVKRFQAYQACNLAEIAIKQNNMVYLVECQKIMEMRKEEYCRLNKNKKDRIQHFLDILAMKEIL